ncbi:MAG TPA: SDR family oxidoreductase [Longimicrobiales bacterium]
MDLGLREKVAVVAASSRGLGRAAADELAAEGAQLVLCARTESTIRAAAAAISKQYDVAVLGIAADLSQPGESARVIDEGIARFGRIDILVTNAGGPPAGPFENHDESVWQAAVRLNLHSVVGLIRAALPGMKARRWGRIINVTSIAVKQPVDNLILSNSIRAAVTGMARTLANEVAPFDVTVNNVLPGYTRTERIEELANYMAQQRGVSAADARAVWEQQVPMGRLGEPREFAALVAFLASERASYITGTSITVDGGWVKSLL